MIDASATPLECQLSTIEYLLPTHELPGMMMSSHGRRGQGAAASQHSTSRVQSGAGPCIFLFVLDTVLNAAEDEVEFEKAKDAIQQMAGKIPANALVGFLSYGKMINVWEVSFQDMSKSYAFQGHRLYNARQVDRLLLV